MKKASLDNSSDDYEVDASALNYNFQTPYPNRRSPSDRQDEGRETQRRVSFSESKLTAQHLNELSPLGTPTKEKAQVADADSPYTDSPVVILL